MNQDKCEETDRLDSYEDCATIGVANAISKCFKDEFISKADNLVYIIDIEIRKLQRLRGSLLNIKADFKTPINPIQEAKGEIARAYDTAAQAHRNVENANRDNEILAKDNFKLREEITKLKSKKVYTKRIKK